MRIKIGVVLCLTVFVLSGCSGKSEGNGVGNVVSVVDNGVSGVVSDERGGGDEKIVDNEKREKSNDKNAKKEELGYLVTNLEDGWVNFRSDKCKFGISFPGDFEWSQHCEDLYHPTYKMTRVLSVGKWISNDEFPYGKEGNISISISSRLCNDECRKNEKRIINEGVTYGGKVRKTTISVRKIELNGEEIVVENRYHEGPIEGPPALKLMFDMYKDGKKYGVVGNIPYANKEKVDLFYEIIKTIELL